MIRIFFIIGIFISTLFAEVDAKLEIVKKANTLPKVVVSMATNSAETVNLTKIKKILEQDLSVSGHFEVINNIDSKVNYEEIPDVLTLSNNGIDLYINLHAQTDASGEYTLNTKLYDINAKSMVQEKYFKTSQVERYPFLSHRVAISINDFFQAPSIEWMDKFVVLSSYVGAGQANIMIADYTLTYKKTIVTGGLNIFPKWASNEQKEIYYTSYNYDKPTLVKLNIFNRKRSIVMQSDGMIACSDVNNDGSKLLITAAPDNQPDIYLYDVKTKKKIKVTKYSGIDVGGQFIEDDNRIVFVSNRLGNPNIFAKNIHGSGVEKLVYHSKNNSSVTTFENNIVYSSRDNDNELGGRTFNLYLMSTVSQDLTRLTSNGINQFPKFSPDGQSLLFIKNYQGVSSVGIIRLNFNSSFLFPLNGGKIQSIDW